MEVPSSEWVSGTLDREAAEKAAPVTARWSVLPGVVRHSFTHFDLELTVLAAETTAAAEGIWAPLDRLGDHALPNLMKKVVEHALLHAGAAD
jgi:A/G-specific adenine glycosylase